MELERLAGIFEQCKVLSLRPQDMLVFRSNARLNPLELAEIHGYLEAQTGHTRILLLTEGADLAVLRPEVLPPAQVAVTIADLRSAHRPVADGKKPSGNSAPGAIS